MVAAKLPPHNWKVFDEAHPFKGCMQIEFIWGKILQVSKFWAEKSGDACAPTLCAFVREKDSSLSTSPSIFLPLKGKLISFVNARGPQSSQTLMHR